MKQKIRFSITFLFFAIFAQAQVLTQRQQWDGPFDIRSTGAPNLIPVIINKAQAASGKILADTMITQQMIQRTGGLLDINNRYKPFYRSLDIPKSALLCGDPYNGACTQGLINVPPTVSCSSKFAIDYADVAISMTYSDFDNDLTTYSSSMAQFDLPACAEIETAYLYWTGNFTGLNTPITLLDGPFNTYTGNGNVFNVTTNSGFNTIKFKTPGSFIYQNVTAVSSLNNGVSYVCTANVTSMLQGTGGGQFWAANIQSYPVESGGGSTSGWALVVILRSSDGKTRRIALWDGLQSVVGTTQFTLTGLTAPALSQFKSYLGFGALDAEDLAYEMDGFSPPGLGFKTNTGNQVTFNPFQTDQAPYKLYSNKGYPADCQGFELKDLCGIPASASDPAWCTVYDGIASSHITTYSEFNGKNGNEITRLPWNSNTLGFDLHHLKLPDNAVSANATSATLTFNVGESGSYSLFMTYIAIEGLQASLGLSKMADKDLTTTGSKVAYTLKIVNNGNVDSYGNDILTDTLDPVTKYVVGSSTSVKYINGIPSAGGIIAPVITSLADRQGLTFTIPVIKRNDSLVIRFESDVLPVTDPVAGGFYANCKRTIYNEAWIEYKRNAAGEKFRSKSNWYNNCTDGGEVKIQIIDPAFDPLPLVLNQVKGDAFRQESIIKHVRKQIFIQKGLDTLAFNLFYDSNGNRIYYTDIFPATGTSFTVFAYRNINGSPCTQKVSVTFTFGTIITFLNEENSNEAVKIMLFPQPLRDISVLKVQANMANEKITAEVYNLSGMRVRTFIFSSDESLEMKNSDFKPGVYLMKIAVSSGREWHEKLVVE